MFDPDPRRWATCRRWATSRLWVRNRVVDSGRTGKDVVAVEPTKREVLFAALQFLLVGMATERPRLDLSKSTMECIRGTGHDTHARRIANVESQVGRILALLGFPMDQIPNHGQSLIDAGNRLLDWEFENL
jgi:hypothetical protein